MKFQDCGIGKIMADALLRECQAAQRIIDENERLTIRRGPLTFDLDMSNPRDRGDAWAMLRGLI